MAGVAKRAKCAGVPVVAVVGAVEDGIDAIYDMGVCGVFSITSCHRQYNLAQTPVFSAAPPRSSITTGAMKEEKMHVGYWKAVLQEELVSLISLPCAELHRQHDT